MGVRSELSGSRGGEAAMVARSGFNPAETFSSLRHRNFRLFFTGQFISLVGSWMQNTAQQWLVVFLAAGAALGQAASGAAEAQASLYLSLIATASSLPVLFGSLYGGVIADRYSKRTIIILTQSAQGVLALALAALIYSGHVTVWQVILFAGLTGLTNVFDVPARQAFVVEMVGKESLANAIALNSSLFNGARAFGPAVAGLLLSALTGVPESTALAICFLANGLSYIAVIIGLLMMRGDFSPQGASGVSPFEATREVFAFLKRHDGARLLVWMVGAFSICIAPYFVLLPSLARFALNTNAAQFGYLMSAQGLGALAGALTIASLSAYPHKGRILTLASVVFPILLIALAFSRSFPLTLVLIMGTGFGSISFLATANTLLQTSTPDALRGRVMGLYAVLMMGLTPIGSLWSGIVAGIWGAPVAIALGAAILAACAITVAVRYPGFRRLERHLPESLQVSA